MARSRKAEREQVRQQLRATGLTVAEIAAEMGRRFRVRPRTAWRYALGWDQWKTVQEYRAANPSAPIDDTRISKWESWPFGGTRPSPEHLAGLMLAFGHGCTVADLVDDDDLSNYSPAERRLIVVRAPALDTDGALMRWQAGPDISDIMEAAVAQAAHETWQHLAADSVSIEPMGIQVMRDQLTELSRAYASTAPALMLTRARQVRDTTFQLMERTKRPSQLVDLHLAAGMSCALLASASFDLGQHGAALAQIRAASQYADMAGHPSLQAWASGFAGLVAYWDGRPMESVQVIEQAIPHAPAGTATARLESIRARAYALMGDRQQVIEALAAADAALGTGQPDEMHDTVGGELGWEDARQDMCAGTALVTVGDARGAAERLSAAVEHMGATTFVDPARADLAAARLLDGDLDGTAEALAPVWEVGVERRRYGFTSRLTKIRTQLTAQGWEGHASARNLHDQIAEYVAEADSHRALLARSSD